MPLYERRSDGYLVTVVRTEHRLGLRELPVARKAIAAVLTDCGGDAIVQVCGYLGEEFDDGSLVGSDVEARLEWARSMVLKAYRRDFEHFPDEIAAFKALSTKGIA